METLDNCFRCGSTFLRTDEFDHCFFCVAVMQAPVSKEKVEGCLGATQRNNLAVV